ncbi:hypothetical protein ACFCV9_12300 [Streptomyces sp. NPDC056367]|uniref:hypothetical protein n=1 Tax=Streptomyces sp. NPDC056367 TaxID=3345797 RepID=UPI0035DC8921
MHGVIGDARARSVRAARSKGYLLGTLMTATVTLVAAPLPGRPGRPGQPGRAAEPRTRALRHDLAWLVTHVATGLPAGALALLCLGNLLLTLAVTVGWWALPPSDPPRLLLLGIRIDGWGPALTSNLAQFLLLAALAAVALPPLARVHARCCLAVLASSAASNATCTTAPRPGWWPSPSGSPWRGRACPRTPRRPLRSYGRHGPRPRRP